MFEDRTYSLTTTDGEVLQFQDPPTLFYKFQEAETVNAPPALAPIRPREVWRYDPPYFLTQARGVQVVRLEIEEPSTIWLSAIQVNQQYGGLGEGSWWRETRERLFTWPIETNSLAREDHVIGWESRAEDAVELLELDDVEIVWSWGRPPAWSVYPDGPYR